MQPYAIVRYVQSPNGDLIQRQTDPGVQVQGVHNLTAGAELVAREELRVGDRVLGRSRVTYYAQIDPGRRISRIGVDGALGDDIDFANVRQGKGGYLELYGTIKPTDHLALDWSAQRQWLDVSVGGREQRLFRAQIARLKATYNFSARAFLRLIGERLDVDRDPEVYTFTAPARSGSFNGSALFAYRLNWQTVLFVGYADDRQQDPSGDLQPVDRTLFTKVSYAFQW